MVKCGTQTVSMPIDIELAPNIGSDLISEAYVDVRDAYDGGEIDDVLEDGDRLFDPGLLMLTVVVGVVAELDGI